MWDERCLVTGREAEGHWRSRDALNEAAQEAKAKALPPGTQQAPTTRAIVPQSWGDLDVYELRKGPSDTQFWPYCLTCL
eukprot:11158925-Lingulodinium_polyedra.AAC.1